MASQLQSTVNDIKSTVSNITTDMVDVKSQLSHLTQEMTKVRNMVVDLVQRGTSLPTVVDLDTVRESIDELNDGPLDKISRALDSLKKSLADLKTESGSGVSEHTMESLREHIKQDFEDTMKGLITRAPVPPSDQHIGKDCIDALLTKTSVMPSNKRNTDYIRILYEKLYSAGGVISSVLEYLRFRSEVKVLVDFDSDSIENLKTKITDHDGKEREGSTLVAFADFQEKVVYLGAHSTSQRWLLAQLAQKLAQLAISMVFKNGGSPYVGGDEQRKGRFHDILAEAERKHRGGEEMELPFLSAVLRESHLAKEIYLISSVPWLMAEFGAAGGATRIGDQLPSLLEYYRDLVMPKLHEESKEELGI